MQRRCFRFVRLAQVLIRHHRRHGGILIQDSSSSDHGGPLPSKLLWQLGYVAYRSYDTETADYAHRPKGIRELLAWWERRQEWILHNRYLNAETAFNPAEPSRNVLAGPPHSCLRCFEGSASFVRLMLTSWFNDSVIYPSVASNTGLKLNLYFLIDESCRFSCQNEPVALNPQSQLR